MKDSDFPKQELTGWQVFKKAYFNRATLAMFLLGFCAGVPFLLIFSSLGLWLREAGIDRATVTMFSWAALGYSFKFIWSPLVDVLPLPILGRLGQRRSWLLLSQIFIISAIIMMAMTDPKGATLGIMAMGAVLLGFSAATQDIAIDAYRIESAPATTQAALSASYVSGYRVGMIVSGAGALFLASYFGSTMESYSYEAWQKTYLIMAGVMSIGIITTLTMREPSCHEKKQLAYATEDYVRLVLVFIVAVAMFIWAYRTLGALLPDVKSVGVAFLLGCVQFLGSLIAMILGGFLAVKAGLVRQEVVVTSWVSPITNFFERYGKKAVLLLALIGLYRISDIVAGNVSNIFYQDLGFTKEQIATAVKTFGVVASIVGGFVGGWFAQKVGIMKAMTLGAVLACFTNLLFILLAHQVNLPTMYLAVLTDNFAAGLASTIFVAFLSALTSIRFTAVQYALFTSLMTLLPKILGGYSGAIVEKTSYSVFFAMTFVIGLPVLYLVYLVHKQIPINTDESAK